jgi:hypothetical protein
VPALGLSSDTWNGSGSPPGPADSKLAGALHWVSAGRPTGELVIASAQHLDFVTTGNPVTHPRMWWATLAWLDRWVAGDTSALSRLAASDWNGEPRSAALSAYYTSAVITPEYTCLDLTEC